MARLTCPVTLLMLILSPILAGAAALPQAAFYVSPSGQDTWSGTLPARNGAGTDGPFATLERARDAVRELKAGGNYPPRGATIILRGGTYELPATFTLTPDDAGLPGDPVVYCAYPGEQPVISAGRRLTGWKVSGGRWTVTLPEVAKGDWDFVQLFVNGQRRFRPRLPRQGYYYIAGSAPSSAGCKQGWNDRFRFGGEELKSSWANLSDVEILAFHTWSTSRLRLSSVDNATGQASVAGGTFRALNRGTRYLVENVKEAVQRPGDWYLDRKTGVLEYLPRPGERPDRTVVVAPRLSRLLEAHGDIAGQHWVSNIAFSGLTFADANWTTPPNGSCIAQAESSMPAALLVEGMRDCVFEKCTFTRMGGCSLELGDGCQRDRIEGCEFTDIGGGGVKVGPTSSNNQDVVTSTITIEDCLLAHLGRLHPAAVGIWVGYGHHINVEHNEIYDLYYSGISMGWSWGYGATPNHDNTILDNLVHDALQNVLTDGAGIYTLGLQPNSVMSGNVVHDLVGIPWAVGLYLDEGSTGWVCENNLVYNVTTHDFNVNYGHDNLARNNIFGPILDPKAPLFRCGRVEPVKSMTVENNLIYYKVGELVDQTWPVTSSLLRNNLYFNAAGAPVKFRDKTFEQWQAMGQDAGSIIANPLFVNPAKGDYTLKPGSPADKVGFKPFDYRSAGRLSSSKTPPGRFPPAFPETLQSPPEAPPIPVKYDFEDQPVGAKAFDAQTQEENDQATIRVTDEQAASGLHSLKFIDQPGQKHFYDPHLFYQPHLKSGTWLGSFDFRMEAGASFSHDWRDGFDPFHTGPSLQIADDGTLTVGKRKLLTLPHSQWVHFAITCSLGDKANGKWQMAVTLPGQEPQTFANLPCEPTFNALLWYGFVATADQAGVFYVDNIALEPFHL